MSILTQADLDFKDEVVIGKGVTFVDELLQITRRGQSIVGSGPDSTIQLRGQGGFFLRGCEDLLLSEFRTVGEGKGAAFASGHFDCRSIIADTLWFEEVGLGISYNAYEGGSFVGGAIRNIHLKNIRGKNPGTGYGVHVAEAYSIDIAGIFADNCERHDLYLAASKGPSWVTARNIRSINHRQDVADGGYRCAIVVSRSKGTTLEDVVVRDCFDGALEVSAVTDPSSGPGDTSDIVVRHFTAYGRGRLVNGQPNPNAYILVGEQRRVQPDEVFEKHLDNVRFENVCLMDENGAGLAEPFTIVNGRDIAIDGLRVASRAHSAIWYGDSRFANADNASDILVRDSFVVGTRLAWTDNPRFQIR